MTVWSDSVLDGFLWTFTVPRSLICPHVKAEGAVHPESSHPPLLIVVQSTTCSTHTRLPLKWRQSLKGLLRRARRDKICPLRPPLFFFRCSGSRCRWRCWQSGWAVDYTPRLNWAEARHPVLQQHRRRLKSPRAVDFFTSEDSPRGAVKWWSILCLQALFNTNMTACLSV